MNSSGPLDSLREHLSHALHRGVRDSRDEHVVEAVCAMAPAARNMLDIGTSDGRIAARVAAQLGIDDVQGVDVELQADPAVPVTRYDGRHVPLADASVDLVTIVDVLHHAEDPASVMREALRIVRPSGRVVVKDHLRHGPWSAFVLLAMDNASNFSVHELTSGRYLSLAEWVNLVGSVGGRIDQMLSPLVIHALPWRMVARSSYQAVFAVSR